MDELTLQDFPLEILMEILSFLPNHKELSLVCKQFYEAVYKLDESEIWLKISKDDLFFTKELLDNFPDYLGNLKITHTTKESPEFLRKFGIFIKDITISGTTTPKELSELLSFTPDCENLNISSIKIERYDSKSLSLPFARRDYKNINLIKLRKLAVGSESHYKERWNLVKELIQNCKLETFESDLYENYREIDADFICDVLKIQNQLRELKVNPGFDEFNRIISRNFKNLTSIESLKVSSREINDSESVNLLNHMRNLKKLSIIFKDCAQSIKSAINLENLEDLEVINIDSAEDLTNVLRKTARNLKRFKFSTNYNFETEISQIIRWISSSTQLEELILSSTNISYHTELLMFPIGEFLTYKNGNLKILHLDLHFYLEIEDLKILNINFPNLNNLKFNETFNPELQRNLNNKENFVEQFKFIIQGFKNLKLLHFGFFTGKNSPTLQIEDLRILQDSACKINKITISGLKIGNFIEIFHNLKEKFKNIEIVDRNSINFEIEEKSNEEKLQKYLDNDCEFKDILMSMIDKGSKIDCIQSSFRQFRHIEIDFTDGVLTKEFDEILNFLEDQYITQFSLKGSLSCSEFKDILSIIPNCKNLTLSDISIADIEDSSDQLSNLRKLKLLEVINCQGNIWKYLKLPKNNLKELIVDLNAELVQLPNNFMEDQKSLKKFILQKFKVNTIKDENFLQNCSLDHLELTYLGNKSDDVKEIILNLINHHKKLKILKLDYHLTDEILLKIVKNLKNLEELSISSIDNLTEKTFVQIQDIKSLQSLTFSIDSERGLTPMSTFVTLDLINLTFLKISYKSVEISSSILTEIANAAPLLKTIAFYSEHNSLDVTLMLEKFNRVEALILEDLYGQVQHLDSLKTVNLNLKVLEISSPICLKLKDLERILTLYRNVAEIHIGSVKYCHNCVIKTQRTFLKTSFDKLESVLTKGRLLKFLYIKGIEMEKNCKCSRTLKSRFKAIEFEGRGYSAGTNFEDSELVMTSDKELLKRMVMKYEESRVVKKALKQF